ncbi:MAG: hypothetical protein A3H69_00585 [Candidatus Sungbacteria bacterium RIFCSPLOWO2_02_FULL_47_9]|nr:MAG: hypothetical protein A3D57_01115 [Candidatus Sungbacteria bacterium RIFCSPHIGHO2_02_FULL_46_12]OHA05027.1 MAG: hypothetical protein A3A28_03780 [Candidatus Sungbacteria bacterium RIFCSPLOWO2_01_FULL_47_32]OHA11859.1 MAG: hypothetical protein A3H69_00585 [Candidatus Sungbacteria bacterium RIFCSPLOWO2_02_FULL_47_9]
MKPNKSILKRVKTTKSGKLLKRRAGIDHFNAKASRGSQTRKHLSSSFSPSYEKKIRQMM